MKKTLHIKPWVIFGLLTIAFVCLSLTETLATHLRAGNILVKKVNNNCLEYEITVVVFTNTNGTTVLFGGDQDFLNFGDGSPIVLVPEIGPGTNVPGATYDVIDGTLGIAKATYTIRHIYRGAGRFTISYIEPNRNAGIANIDQSVNVTFYLETQILIDPFLGCSSPPDLLVDPVDQACSGAAWFHNPGAQDNEGDSLSFQFVQPFRDRGSVVPNYRDPNSPEFYTEYATGNETDDGEPTFDIDPIFGTITWNAPDMKGEYNIAFIIIEWRKVRGVWYRMGFVRRDMQILVADDCNNERPDLEIPDDICVVAGETITEEIFGTDPDGDRVKIEAFSNVFELSADNQSPATLTPDPPIFQNVKATATFQWATTCQHVQDQPYSIVFRVEDERGLVSYKTWSIRVVGPPPTWQDAQLVNRTATITWDPYICQNADSIQIWRKVDESAFVPDTCFTGMPAGLGYERIANVLVKNGNVFIDNNKGKGLAPGARYCYRLVAVFSSQLGGESLVSLDTCVGPIEMTVPMITKVSILQTSETAGEIKVKWTRPLDADLTDFPLPYRYVVTRATGFIRANDSTLVTITAPASADTLSIMDVGLNTSSLIYNYSVMAIAANDDTVGTSVVASSVRLEASAEGVEAGQVQLTWAAAVPWSNQISTYPRHLIYRGDAGATEAELVLIDSVDVTANGFVYVDSDLVESQEYCYKILTRGSYGNPQLEEPLLNFSQIICVEPGDDVPPCPPVLTVDLQDCSNPSTIQSLCFATEFSNNLSWNLSNDPSCQDDVKSIRIYRSTHGNPFALLAEVPATVNNYLDRQNLDSYAACYKIISVDRSGNESEESQTICNDNCPYYELPNVFTPNGDGTNDKFSAYSVRNLDCEGDECEGYALELIQKCARFVQAVKFTAYNRWGQEVYTYEANTLAAGSNTNSIYIDWDGRDADGNKLPNGVYYYLAEVTFNTSNQQERVKTYKGWIHLLYDVDRSID